MKRLKCYTLAGILFVSIAGTLSHFLYQFSGNNYLVGLFSPVSESTWEHIKLLFFPMLLYSLWMSAGLREQYPGVVSALAFGNLAGCALIPIIFYTYTGVLGFHLLSLDIVTFLLSVLAAFLIAFHLTQSGKVRPYEPVLTSMIGLMVILFFLFTYCPPGIGLFMCTILTGRRWSLILGL